MPEKKLRTRYLLIPAVLSVCAAAGAQTVVTPGRPVADAILKLEPLYGWAITYEDTPYVYDGDIEDVTSRVRKDRKSASRRTADPRPARPDIRVHS